MESPIKQADLERIKAHLKELEEAERFVDQAIRAGFDVSAEAERIRESKASLIRIRSVFFPNQ